MYIYPFGCSFLVRQAGWPVGWNWLLPPGVTGMPVPIQVRVPIQVQANKINWHQPVDLTVFPVPPPPVRLCFPELAPGLGASGGSSPPDAAAAPASGCGCCACVRRGGWGGGGGGGGISSVCVRRTFGIHLVLELALDDLGLGATAGVLNPLDVLIILVSCQNCLQLPVCYLKESGFIWVYTSTITLSC